MMRSELSRWWYAVVPVVLALLQAPTVLAAVDRSQPPPLGPVTPFTLSPPTTFTLRNGLTVHFLERHRLPLFSVVATINAGALLETDGQEGTAVAVADLLTEGAADRDAFAWADALQAIGADVDAGADWEATTVSAGGLSSQLRPALGLMADAIIRPRLDPAEWERVRGETLGALAYYANEPRALSALAAARALFPTGRQGTAIMGTPASVSALTVDALRAFHARAYRPDTTTVVIVGDLSEQEARAAMEAAFGSWKAPEGPPPRAERLEPASIQKRRVLLLDRPGAAQSSLQIVAPIPPSTPPFDAAAGVMQTLLGGSFTSRLNTNLRETHGYAYGAGYGYDVRPAHRSRVSTSVASPVTTPAIHEILEELARIRTPASDEEVARARAYEALTFPSNLDGVGSQARAWATWKALDVPDVTITGYMGRVLAVKSADVVDAATRLVNPEGVAIVVVGDAASLEKELGRFGVVSRIKTADLLPAAR